MFLNDAFDRAIDARERPERPIPSGAISAGEVFGVGFSLLGLGLLGLVGNAALRSESPMPSVAAGVVLAALIVLYDAWHKGNALSPVVMGLCRGAVYVTAGLASGGSLGCSLILGALVLAAYVVGLTFVARQENRKSYRAGATLALVFSPVALAVFEPNLGVVGWGALALFVTWASITLRPLFSTSPNVPLAVVRLIAGISLVDGLLAAAFGMPLAAPLGVAGLLATLALQRWVNGT
jgi:4-hydroxybenzoate polyprenyltransferase